jgi:ADP-heptose:LPS heptosyltransferase
LLDSTQRIVVTRFSAMGDVAMTLPVIKAFLEQNKNVDIIFVTRAQYYPFFKNLPNCRFVGVDFIDRYKGILGIFRLFKILKSEKPTAYVDLHAVLRSYLLCVLFFLSGVKTTMIDKGRKEKKALIRQEKKYLKQLKNTPERYADVFRSLGFTVNLSYKLENHLKIDLKNNNAIGVAPFAQHRTKIYPLDRMKRVVLALVNNGEEIYLFGGGKKEKKILDSWDSLHPNISSMVGNYSLEEELKIIGGLNLMLSMDSANMHLASLVGVPVVSIWGSTHPFAGFMGYGQNAGNIIQRKDLPCRPCSIYGNKPCELCDGESMNISENKILDIINSIVVR